MTPKEKAKELINKYKETDLKPFSDYGYYMDKDAAKKFALIEVHELANEVLENNGSRERLAFFIEVKNEIEKL